MKDYIQAWYEQLRQGHQLSVRSPVEITGTCDKVRGWTIVTIKMLVEPAEAFEVIDEREASNEPAPDEYVEQAINGLLDVIATQSWSPILKIRVRLRSFDFHSIETSYMSCRRAGRKAGEQLVEIVHNKPAYQPSSSAPR